MNETPAYFSLFVLSTAQRSVGGAASIVAAESGKTYLSIRIVPSIV
jgi:hypothetical protein